MTAHVPRTGWNKRKLTEEQVREIKAALAEGRTGVDIAREYGVRHSTISEIKTGQRYGWVKP